MGIGIGILLPVYYTADPPPGKETEGFDTVSLANVDPEQKNLLWASMFAVWGFTFLVLYFLYKSYQFYYLHRARFLSRPKPEWYSVLVSDIPEESRDEDSLRAFFTKRYGDEGIYSVMMARDMADLDELVEERNDIVRELENAHFTLEEKEDKDDRPMVRPKKKGIAGKLCCCCGTKVDAIEYYSSEVERLNDEIATAQAAEHEVTPSGFVSFTTLANAVSAIQTLQVEVPLSWKLERAPAPADVYWPNLKVDGRQKTITGLIVTVLVVLLCFGWAIPVAMIAVIAIFNKLAETIPALKPVVNFSPVLTGLLQAMVPTILLVVFMALLPKILLQFGKRQGLTSESELAKSVMRRYFLFLMVNVLLVTTIAGSIIPIANKLADGPLTVIDLLGQSIPGVAIFFILYVMLQALSGFPLMLLRPAPLILGYLKGKRAKTAFQDRAAWAPGEIFYGADLKVAHHLPHWAHLFHHCPRHPPHLHRVLRLWLRRIQVQHPLRPCQHLRGRRLVLARHGHPDHL